MNRAEKRRQQKLAKKAAKKAAPNAQTEFTPDQALGLAIQHHKNGRLAEAERIYQQILQFDAHQPDALHLLGLMAHQRRDDNKAVELITKALAIKPDYVEAYNNLGNAFRDLGKLDDAATSYHKALDIHPNYVEAHFNLGNVLQDLRQLDEAVVSYQRALAIQPDYVDAYNNLGNALQDLGRQEQAADSYKKALALNADFADAHLNLGIALQGLGNNEEALTCHRRAIALAPENDSFWAALATSMSTIAFTSVDDRLWQDLSTLLERPTVSPFDVIHPTLSALRHHPEFASLLEMVELDKPETEFAYNAAAQTLARIPLFLRTISLGHVNDLDVERLLTDLRRAMLQETLAGTHSKQSLPFAAALALQCYANEYVFAESAAERSAVEQLIEQITGLVEGGQDVPPSSIIAVGAYRALSEMAWAVELSQRAWDEVIQDVVERQILEPQVEQNVRFKIPQLSTIENDVSQSVRQQYEQNPYPRWTKTGISDTCRTIRADLQSTPLCFDLGEYASPQEPEILVAGCGTGQHAVFTASRFENARVLAVDLSLSSLSYANRKAKELQFSNIEFAQADILELGSLERRFDLIESSGVLHHLDDPLAGWRVLVDLLRPGGVMKIGLYSKIARRDISAGRAMIADKGYSPSAEDIRQCRQDIIALSRGVSLQGQEAMAKICAYRDFFSLSECRDLLFHVQEHLFTLPKIEEALQDLKLCFLGFEMNDQRALCAFKTSHPDKSALTSLALWNAFEQDNPDTFQGMYQFWCQKT